MLMSVWSSSAGGATARQPTHTFEWSTWGAGRVLRAADISISYGAHGANPRSFLRRDLHRQRPSFSHPHIKWPHLYTYTGQAPPSVEHPQCSVAPLDARVTKIAGLLAKRRA